ncbi:MAG: hypothetical protein E6098_12280 [Cutibacterium avidum]|nr:hypothetical protein [Cutibacterium avidum]
MTTLSEAIGGAKALVRKYAPKSLMWRVAPIRLYWAGSNDANANFGDQLSPLLIRNLFGAEVKYSGIGAADMVAVGSILEGIQNLAETCPWIWGSGFVEPGASWNGPDIKVLALRGALSMERFIEAGHSEVPLGDPGILVRQALPHLQWQPSDRIGFVPHFTERDNERSREIASHPAVKLIDVCAPVEAVVSDPSVPAGVVLQPARPHRVRLLRRPESVDRAGAGYHRWSVQVRRLLLGLQCQA